MPRFMFGTDDPNVAQAMMALAMGHAGTGGAPTGMPARPAATMPAMPPAPAAMPPPPAPAAPPAGSGNPQMDNVLRLMDAYARAGHQVAGVKKVLNQLQLSRVQDANPEQLAWLEQAFGNHAYVPPG